MIQYSILSESDLERQKRNAFEGYPIHISNIYPRFATGPAISLTPHKSQKLRGIKTITGSNIRLFDPAEGCDAFEKNVRGSSDTSFFFEDEIF